MSERLAEAADTAEVGRVPGMPSTSPWQRSNAVWHRAGIDWSRAEPEQAPGRSAAVAAPSGTAAYPAVSPPGAAAYPAVSPSGPAAPPVPAPRPAPDDAGSPDAEPWGPPRRRRGLAAVPVRPVAIAAAAVLVLGAGAYVLFAGGDDKPRKPVMPPAVDAGRLFTVDPAASSGRAHTLAGVVASDRTVVAIGSEQGGVYSRGQFLVSADGGRAWSVAQVHAANGGDPPPAEYPQLLAGGTGAWAALGGTPAGTVPWTSRDGRTWIRQAASSAFRSGDTMNGLARTRSGFVAVGGAVVQNGTQAVLWTSGDGLAWTRLGADQLKPPPGGTVVRLWEVAANGDTVLVRGTLRTTMTVDVTVKKKKKKVQRTVEREAFWQSPDGGRSWASAGIPQAQGSYGNVVAAVATQAGFFAIREGAQTTGSKKKRTTVRYAVIFSSPDGRKWAPAGRLSTGGYARVGALRGGDSGMTGLVSVAGGKTAVMTSGDGRTWRRVGDLPPGRALTGAALAPQGPVVTGRLDDGDAYLTVAGAGDVRLPAVPDAVHPERTVAGIAAAPGQTVAVGSTNGHAALWTSPDGSSWTRAKLPAPAGSGPQRLTGAVRGGQGWLAVGGGDGGSLVVMSADGRDWQPVPGGKVFGGPGIMPSAAAASGSAYVVVGRQNGASATAWYSTDLKNWAWSGNVGTADLTGAKDAPKWMNDVVASPAGFVAVGGQTKNKTSQPALWTSPDGRKWTLSATPPALPAGTGEGSLTRIAVRNGVLVAAGNAGPYAFAAVSSDGGRTWQPASLPGVVQDTQLTAATATPHGFVLAGTSGSDVIMWTSADGRTWRASRPHGHGLDGPGLQRLDGMTVVGPNLTAVGFIAGNRGDGPTLWRTPVP